MAMQLRKISLATGGIEPIVNVSEENLDAVIKFVVDSQRCLIWNQGAALDEALNEL
jgi:hypothetical protein